MALKDTVKSLRDLLTSISHDLEKSDKGNKAASQRVRTGTVRLEKIAKLYRKESIKSERQNKGSKKPVAKKTAAKSASAKPASKSAAKSAVKPAAKSTAKPVAKKPAAKSAPVKSAPVKSAKVKAKAKPKAHTARARA